MLPVYLDIAYRFEYHFFNELLVLLSQHTRLPRGNSIRTPALDYDYIYCTPDGLFTSTSVSPVSPQRAASRVIPVTLS